MVKEAFIEAADSMFRDFKNKAEISYSIKALQLSRRTVARRCEAMGEDLSKQCGRTSKIVSVSHSSGTNLRAE